MSFDIEKHKEYEMSSITIKDSQSPITDGIMHYRNLFASPENFIRRKVDYSRMKVYDEKFRKESERLESLKGLPLRDKELLSLIAKSGFFNKNSKESDEVCCIYCQGTLSNWKKNDVPMKRHRFSYPTCPYVIFLNVGNEPMSSDCLKVSNEDPDVVKPTMVFEISICRPDIGIMEESINKIDYPDFDFREKTFIEFPPLKDLAFRGIYIIRKDLKALLKCSWCSNEILILKGAERLADSLLHKTDCLYIDIENIIDREVEQSKSSMDFCQVEYALTTEEIDARMDMRQISQLLYIGTNPGRLRSVIEHQLKTKGKDFESTYDLLYQLKKDVNYDLRKISVPGLDIALAEFPCVVCLDNPVSTVFLPCGHLKTCSNCSLKLIICPVCRLKIEKRVKGFRFQNY